MGEVIIKKELESDDENYGTHLNDVQEYENKNHQITHDNILNSSKEDDGTPQETKDSTYQDTPNDYQSDELKVPYYSLHICNICGETCKDLEIHLLTHDGEKPVFKCEQCHKIYPDAVKLKRHKYTHKYNLSIKCELCDRTFTSLPNLTRHMPLHNGAKPFSCIECKQAFTRRDKVNMHMLSVHGLKSADCFTYQINNDDIGNEDKLKNTQISTTDCLDLNNGKCEAINDNTVNIKSEVVEDTTDNEEHGEPSTSKPHDANSRLFDNSRINLKMSSLRLYYCDICEKDFANSSILKRHMLIHTGEKPHECTLCGKRYRDICKLREHMRMHDSDSPLFCDICSKSFSEKANLKRHKIIHSANKPHQCDLCDKKFNRKDHLKAHNLIHMWNGDVGIVNITNTSQCDDVGETPDTCVDDRTSPAQNIHNKEPNNHRTKQTNGRKTSLECEECHKVFTKISNLKRHKLVHTNNKLFNIKEIHEKKIDEILRKYQESLLCVDQSSEITMQPSEQCIGDEMRTNHPKQDIQHAQTSIWNPYLDSEITDKKYKTRNESSISDSTEFNKGDKYCDVSDEVKCELVDDISDTCENKQYSPYQLDDYNVNKLIESTDCDNGEQGNNFIEISVPGANSQVFDDSTYPTLKKCKKKKKGNKKHKEKTDSDLFKVKRKIGFFPCNQCDGIYETRLLLRRHECPNKETFDCDGCGKKFLYLSALRTHQVVHSKERPFECPVCMKGFSLIHHLKGHMLIHSGEKRHQCDECMKKFISSSDLKKHIYSHTGEKKYPCQECHKMFKRSCDVKRHMLTHTGVKPHVCGYCNKGFSQAPHLNSHLLIHFREFQPRETSEIVFGNG